MLSLGASKSLLVALCLIVLIVNIGCVDVAEYRVYVAFGDSITEGLLDSDLTNGVGYPAHLSDMLPAPGNIVHNAGDRGDTSQEGLGKIEDVLLAYPQSTHFLIQFGTNDALGSTTLDEYRSNMRGIIRAIEQVGKVPLLAHIPPDYHSTNPTASFGPPCDLTLPQADAVSQRFQQFNQVIGELVSEYNLEVEPGRPLIPPDFHGYFLSTETDDQGTSVEFSDCVHPNDIGYRSMARLWLDALQGGPIDLDEPRPFTEIYVHKTDIERLSGSTEFQPDDHLVFDVGEHERWTFEAILWVKTTDSAGDFRFLWRGPNGSDVRANVVAYQGNRIVKQANQLGMNVIWSVDYPKPADLEPIYVKGVFSTGDTGGRIRLEWAQRASSGKTGVFFPSYLESRRVQSREPKQIWPRPIRIHEP